MSTSRKLLSWIEIPAIDIKRAKNFYEAVFEIRLNELEIGKGFKMALFQLPDSHLGGALVQNEEFYTPSNTHGPVLYFDANPDLQVFQDRIEPAGGKVTISKRQIAASDGFIAIFEDTEGNRMALYSDN